MTTRPKLLGSASWVGSSFALGQALRFAQAIVIARWLGPSEMGLYAYVYSILTFVDLLEKIGADQVFIARSPNQQPAENHWLMGCWTVRIALACCVTLIIASIAAATTAFSTDSRLGYLLALISPISILIAARSPRMMLLNKRQAFIGISKFEIFSALVRTALPLALVFFNRTVEWLVFANVIAAAFITACSYAAFPIALFLRVPRKVAKELYFYGRNNVVISALTVAQTSLDDIAIGTFFNRSILGFYSTGYRLAMVPHSLIQSIAYRMLMPRYRTARDTGLAKLVDCWRAVALFLAPAYATLLAPVILLADWGVEFTFGPEWRGMSTVLKFAAYIAFFRGVTISISSLFTIMGAPDVDAKLKVAEVSVFLVFVALGSVAGVFELFLWGGIVCYCIALVTRAIWWHRTLRRAGFGGLRGIDIANPLAGLGILLVATAVDSTSISPTVPLTILLMLLIPLLVSRARKLGKEFAG